MHNALLLQPKLGIGTWFLGEKASAEKEELAALQYALDRGVTIIDTAEMYGNGKAERLVGKAIQPFNRDKLYLISKVLPSNANKKRMEASLDASLKALQSDYLDLYLYHWRGGTPLSETVSELERLKSKGKIKAWGVSNFDLEDMEELLALPAGSHCQANEVLYHLGSRGIEYCLKPFQDQHHIPTIAYCPLAQAGSLQRKLLHNKSLPDIAQALNINIYQLLLAFTLAQSNMISIPRTGQVTHMKELIAAQDIKLTPDIMEQLNKLFPAPQHRLPLDIQ